MPTQQPLVAMIDDILNHIKVNENLIEHNKRLFDIYGGQLQKYVEEALDRTLESAEGRRGAKKRVAPINVLPKVVSKLSQVYTESANRTTDDPDDQELMDMYASEIHFDRTMAGANELFNLHKYVGLEPYRDIDGAKLRVLPAHQFLPYSDDPVNPDNPTVMIKFMGTEREPKDGVQTATITGAMTEQASQYFNDIDIYYVYSDAEFLVLDSKGRVRHDKMNAVGNPDGVNPVGALPIVYISRDPYRLLPLADSDMLTMTLLIPIMFSNLNYAIEYLCHSITYLTGGDEAANSKIKFLPDSVVVLPEGAEMGTISPDVDSDKVLALVQTYLAMWLETKNIKTSGAGALTAQSAASGIAKIIDEADATQDRKFQTRIFRQAEQQLWSLIARLHNLWASRGEAADRRQMNPSMVVSIKYGEMKPFVSEQEQIQTLQMKLNAGLISRRRALKQANPELTDAELDDMEREIEAEQKGAMINVTPNGDNAGG